MAGLGSRFRARGYETPKPLIPIHGVEMYKVVLANLFSSQVSRVVLLCPTTFKMKNLEVDLSSKLGVQVTVVEVEGLTSGPAATVALARDLLDPKLPLVIANSDQFVAFQPDSFYSELENSNLQGIILTMRDLDPKWSYVALDDNQKVTRVVEKQVISDFATVGIYGFKYCSSFLAAFDAMVDADFRVNGEHYVAPAYEFMPQFESGVIGIHDLGPVGEVMFGLGIPEDLEGFLVQEISSVAADQAKELFG
jgi:dTDP-glucose pyrophosphorylase